MQRSDLNFKKTDYPERNQGLISEEEKQEFIYLDERAQDYIPGIDSSDVEGKE